MSDSKSDAKSDSKKSNHNFKWRTLVSLGTTLMFLIMGITGLVLYVVPQGRIAYWVNWQFLGLSKSDWGNVHIVASIVFVILGGFHLFYNWKAFVGHIRKKASHGFLIRKELIIASAVTVVLTVGAIWKIPPVAYLIEFNEYIKNSWIESSEDEPPFGHAELLSLKMLSKKTNIDVSLAITELKHAGYVVESKEHSLEKIADKNNVSPKDIFITMNNVEFKNSAIKDNLKRKPFEKKPFKNKTRLTADEVFEKFSGTGLGRKSLLRICKVAGEKPSRCSDRLKANSIKCNLNETVRQVAVRADMSPVKILQLMLVDL